MSTLTSEPATLRSTPAMAPVVPPERPGVSWPRRWLDTISAYLPLLLMALLALGTWWLVKNTPLSDAERPVVLPNHEPDYTMSQFVVQRFGVDGVLRVQLEGDAMRHYADTDTLEIDQPRIRVFGTEGRETVATARTALSNRDGSEVQLTGDAHVVRRATDADPAIDFRSEFLHYFQYTERVQSHLPVVVTRGRSEIHADAMSYDNLARDLEFKGRVRALLAAPPQLRRP